MQPVTFLDLDGCIVDSSQPILRSLSLALTEVGLEPIGEPDLPRVVGPPLAETVPQLLAERGAPDIDPTDLIARYRASYRTTSIALARAYPGVEAAIDELARWSRIGVVTSKPLAFAQPILGALGLLDRFEIVEGPSLVESERKPVTLGRALDRLGPASDAQIVMVGDRHHDIEAGRHHGTLTVGVTWGFGSPDELREAGADRLAETPSELPAVVAELVGATGPGPTHS